MFRRAAAKRMQIRPRHRCWPGLSCLGGALAQTPPASLHCGHDVHWHYVRTKLALHFEVHDVEDILRTPLGRPILRSRPHSSTRGWITEFPGPWDLLMYCQFLLIESDMHADESCLLGRFAFVVLNLLLEPTIENYSEIARCFSHMLRVGFSVVELTTSGWPVWALLELAVGFARLRGIRYGHLTVACAALGRSGRDNVSLPVEFGTVLRSAMRHVARIPLRIRGVLAASTTEHGALHSAGLILREVAPANLGQTMLLLAAGLPLWKLLALLQRHRFLRGGCPPHSLLLNTLAMGQINATSAEVPSVLICLRSSYRHPIDAFLVQTGSFPDCVTLLRIAGSAREPGREIALDIGANIGACALPLAQLGYRVVAFEPQRMEAEMLRASAQANCFSAPGLRRLQVVEALAANTTGAREVLVAHQSHIEEVKASMAGRQSEGPLWVGMMIRPQSGVPSAEDSSLASISSVAAHAVRIDDLRLLEHSFDGEATLGLMKVDAEMHEEEVFAGSRTLLLAAARTARAKASSMSHSASLPRPLVHFEYAPRQMEALGLDPLGPPRLLARLGYAILDADGRIIRAEEFPAFAQAQQVGTNLQARPRVRGWPS